MLVQFHVVGDEEGVYYPHFKGKETEAQTGVATCLRPQLMSNRVKDSPCTQNQRFDSNQISFLPVTAN